MPTKAMQAILDYNEKRGYSVDADSLRETLSDGGKTVWKGPRDKHRWFEVFTHVKDFDGVLVGFEDYCSLSEEASCKDMDLEIDLSSIYIYEAREKVTTVYEPVGE